MRRRGRPRLRWEDCIKRYVKKTGEEGDWKKKTGDREGWRRIADEAVKKLQAAPHPDKGKKRKRERHTHANPLTKTRTHTCTRTYTQTHPYIHIQTHTQTYRHTQTHTDTHMHTQTQKVGTSANSAIIRYYLPRLKLSRSTRVSEGTNA